MSGYVALCTVVELLHKFRFANKLNSKYNTKLKLYSASPPRSSRGRSPCPPAERWHRDIYPNICGTFSPPPRAATTVGLVFLGGFLLTRWRTEADRKYNFTQ